MSVPLRTDSLCSCVPDTKVNGIKFSLTRTGLLGGVTSSQWLCWFRLVSSEVPLLELFEFLPLYKWISFLTDEVAMWESVTLQGVLSSCMFSPSFLVEAENLVLVLQEVRKCGVFCRCEWVCHVLSHAQMSSMVLGQPFFGFVRFSFACPHEWISKYSASSRHNFPVTHRHSGPRLIPWWNVLSSLPSSKAGLTMHCTFSITIQCEWV